MIGSAIFFGLTAIIGWAFLAWTYTPSGKKWLKNL